MKLLVLAAALLASPPELTLTMGREPAAPGTLTVHSVDRGTDDLAILREGEWSVGHLTLSAPAVMSGTPALTLRLKGAASRAPRPVLVRRGPVPLPDGSTLTQESYVTTTRRDGEDVVASIPFPPVAEVADRYDLVDLTHSVEWVADPTLDEDPRDRAPLGGRSALIFLHGTDDPFVKFRSSSKFKDLLATFKPYRFDYPSYRAAKDNGEALARLVQRKLPGATRVALISHGMSAPVMRHAAAAMPRRVALQISFAGAHRGSILASLLYANERAVERLGASSWLVARFGQRGEPDTPGLRSVCWDNHDGTVTQQQIREHGIRVNPELAQFNAADANVAKLVCLHGDVSTLKSKSPIAGLAPELLRQAAAALNPVFANIDPIVPFGSGVLEGSSRHQVHTYPDLDHSEIATRDEPWADALGYLRQLATGAQRARE